MTVPRVSPSEPRSQPVISEKFTAVSNHVYQCRCDICLIWWAQVGPEPDEDNYGPFTEAEVEAEIARLAALE